MILQVQPVFSSISKTEFFSFIPFTIKKVKICGYYKWENISEHLVQNFFA